MSAAADATGSSRGRASALATVLRAGLFTLKFYEHSHDVSAAWIWARIKRVWHVAPLLMQEELGYLEGGSETLVQALVLGSRRTAARIRLASPTARSHGRTDASRAWSEGG